MPRALNATLEAALDAQNFSKPIIRAYLSFEDGTPLEVTILSYTLRRNSLKAKIYTTTFYDGQQEVYNELRIERGLEIAGVEYTVTTMRYVISTRTQKEQIWTIEAEIGDPFLAFVADGDVTYNTIITEWAAVLTGAGFGVTYMDNAADWLDYQFLPDGKQVVLNRANTFQNMLAQKYFIFVTNDHDDDLYIFSTGDSFARSTDWTIEITDIDVWNTDLIIKNCRWVDENGTYNGGGSTSSHNLGYLESTAELPDASPLSIGIQPRSEGRPIKTLPFHLKYLTGDRALFTKDTKEVRGILDVTEILNPDADIAWRIELANLDYLSNTEGGSLPSTIERVSNYTPINTSAFDNILSDNDNNLQAAMDTLDDHDHDADYEPAGSMATHTGDTSDAHDASAISIADSGGHFAATDVEGALQQLGGMTTPIILGTHARGAQVPASTTYYSTAWKDTLDATANACVVPITGTLKNLFFSMGAQPASGSLVLTLQKNGVDTAITVTVAAGSAGGNHSDTTHTVSITAGDTITFKAVNNATANSGAFGAITVALYASPDLA